MSLFGKKVKEASPDQEGKPSFIEWALSSDFFTDIQHPAQRTQKLVDEIRRRTLSDTVLILRSDFDHDRLDLLFSSPHEETPVPPEILRLIAEGIFREKRILTLQELCVEETIDHFFLEKGIRTALATPIQIQGRVVDLLILIDYSVGKAERIVEFIVFVSVLVGLSLENVSLFTLLENRGLASRKESGKTEGSVRRGLLSEEERFRCYFEASPFPILIHTTNGEILEANRSAKRFLGLKKGNTFPWHWSHVVDETHRDRIEQFFEEVGKSEKALRISIPILKTDGQVLPVELVARRLLVGEAVYIESGILDLRREKKALEELERLKTLYRIFVETSPVGSLILQNGLIRELNEKFAGLCGKSIDELRDSEFVTWILPEDRSFVLSREIRRQKGEEVPEHYEARLVNTSKETWWAEFRCRRVTYRGEPGILIHLFDITQRKRLELQLIEQQKMEAIGTLAGGIAHDFNNLLGGILGYASLLLSDMPKDHLYYEDIHTIAETAKKAADLTNRLLAFARGGKYHVTAVDCNRTVRDVVAILSRTVDPSIQIETYLGKNLWMIRGDAQQIHQALSHICQNAIEVMPGGGTLTLSTSNVVLDDAFSRTHVGIKPGDYVRITITDTGIGMDEKTRSRIFEPFFTTKPAQAAKGLGLAMVYGIVKNHEGTILVDSTLGQGTKVTLFFPRHQGENTIELDEKDTAVRLKKTILVVDDEAVIRRVAKRMLEKNGYEVILAKDGEEACAIFRSRGHDIHLVLMDLIMPGLKGTEVAERIRALDPKVPILFTSGYGYTDHPEMRKYGDHLFIQKPFLTENLIQKIRETLK